MAWPHHQKAIQQYYETGLDVEPSGQEKEGRPKTPGVVTLRQTSHANRVRLATTGEDRPGQETLERSCAWPMLQDEPMT